MTLSAEKQPLAGVRVIEFGQYIAGPMLATLLADAGADVTRIEMPGGPRLDDPGNAYLLRGRARTIAADLKDADEQRRIATLIDAADVVVENFRPGVMARLGLGADACMARNPRLIYCALPGFAAADPRASLAGWEGVIMAAGSAYWRPTEKSQFFDHTIGALPPFSSLPIASVFAAGLGALAVAGALVARDRDGAGQHIEVPLSDALLEASGIASTTIARPEPFGPVMAFGAAIYRARDARVLCVPIVVHRHLAALAQAAGKHHWIESGLIDYERLLSDPDLAAKLKAEIIAMFAERDGEEWERIFQAAGVPLGLMRSTREWLRHPAAQASGCVVTQEDPRFGSVRTAGKAVEFSCGTAVAQITPSKVPASAPPLAGFKVLDLSRVVAGPTAARMLADLGADVIKVDADPAKARASYREPTFHVYVNRGKRGAVLDLKQKEDRAQFDTLLSTADVLVTNIVPSGLQGLGLEEQDIRSTNPGLVFAYLNTYGNVGPWSGYRGYAEVANAATGVSDLTSGWHTMPSGSQPVNSPPWPYTDSMCGILSAFGTVAALFKRGRNGHGYRVDSSLTRATLLEQMPFAVDSTDIDPFRGRDIATPFYRIYKAADGDVFVAVHADDRSRAMQRIGVTWPHDDPEPLIAQALETMTADTCVERLCFGKSSAAKVQTLAYTMSADGPWARRGLRLERPSQDYGVVVTQAPVPRLSRTPFQAGPTPRAFGADRRVAWRNEGNENA
jgi:crotonobetainyl-CoA:carnitine CoA-transferase CaiB-like acyl-CoA transferase